MQRGTVDGHAIASRTPMGRMAEPEEIAEVITHSCAYAGFPAAIAAMRTAEEVLREVGATPTSP